MTMREPLSEASQRRLWRAWMSVDMAAMPQVPPEAPCRLPGSNPDDWHDPFLSPDLIGVPHTYLDEVAASLCEGCPALLACRRWGVDNPQQGGILGGLSQQRRQELHAADRSKSGPRTTNRPCQD